MRKIITLITIIFFAFTAFGCEKPNPYLQNVSELRQDIYVCDDENYPVTAYYGFRENPFVNDGKCGDRIYGYTFIMHVLADEVQRTVEFDNGNTKLSAQFKYDEVSGEYKAFIETNTHFEKSFSINLLCGATTIPLLLSSAVPSTCLTHENALNILCQNQKTLLDAYSLNGTLNAEIYMRVFVKNDKPYWYVGIASGNDKLKAFLMDGSSGELLAIRDIF